MDIVIYYIIAYFSRKIKGSCHVFPRFFDIFGKKHASFSAFRVQEQGRPCPAVPIFAFFSLFFTAIFKKALAKRRFSWYNKT